MDGVSSDAVLSVSVDRVKCCGYAICAEICPDVFKIDKEGFVVIETPLVSADLADSAREGAESCPELAISVRELVAGV